MSNHWIDQAFDKVLEEKEATIRKQQAEIDKLVQALHASCLWMEEYGMHSPNCKSRGQECICGLTGTLLEARDIIGPDDL
jgi:hypothetical protein